jgi:hypothetical protein
MSTTRFSRIGEECPKMKMRDDLHSCQNKDCVIKLTGSLISSGWGRFPMCKLTEASSNQNSVFHVDKKRQHKNVTLTDTEGQ